MKFSLFCFFLYVFFSPRRLVFNWIIESHLQVKTFRSIHPSSLFEGPINITNLKADPCPRASDVRGRVEAACHAACRPPQTELKRGGDASPPGSSH